MDLSDQFDACLVRNAAGVLAGMKPAALFNFIPAANVLPTADADSLKTANGEARLRRACHQLALDVTRRLSGRGVRVEVLVTRGSRSLMLASRPRLLEGLLADAEVCAFLAGAGYAVDCAPRVVSCLRRRLRAYELAHEAQAGGGGTSARDSVRERVAPRRARAVPPGPDPCEGCVAEASCARRHSNPWRPELAYPHEVGVLLGYPLADVRGFIERQGRGATDVGPWKTYGDVAQARATWDRLRTCERLARERWEHGATLEELVA